MSHKKNEKVMEAALNYSAVLDAEMALISDHTSIEYTGLLTLKAHLLVSNDTYSYLLK